MTLLSALHRPLSHLPSPLLGTFPARSAVMFFFVLAHVWSALLDLIWCGRHAGRDTDIEILLLRQQLRILQRKQPRPPRISRWEKLALLMLAGKLTRLSTSARQRLAQVVVLFKPEPCSHGTVSSYAENGPSRSKHGPDDHRSIPSSKRCSCVWPRRTQDGATVRCRANSANWGTTSGVRPSALCSSGSTFPQPPNAASLGVGGARFSRTTQTTSLPVTSSPSRPRG